MKRFRILLSTIALILIFVIVSGGCTYEPARRYIQTDPNDMNAPNGQAMPNNLVGRNGENDYADRISSTFEMVDFSNLNITSDNLIVRSGAGSNYPSVGKLKSGQKIRALGKMDGWYVVKLPDSGRVGCIQADYAKPDGVDTTTDTRTAAPAPKPDTAAGGGAGAGGAAGGGTAAGTAGGGTAAGAGTMTSDEARILQLVNAERAKVGAKALTSSSECTRLARMKSQDMVNKNYFSHQSPTYGSPFDMLKSYKVSYMYAGENIAMNQSADAAFKAWMNSEGHKKNILNPNFTELGVGIAPKGDGSNIYTQLFIGR